jgi:hypothetical protein
MGSGMLANKPQEVTVPNWRVYVELQTSSLADDIQLAAIAALLGADAALADASPSAASLGSRYSVTATITLGAGNPQAAQNLAMTALQRACASAGVSTEKVLASGLVPNQ